MPDEVEVVSTLSSADAASTPFEVAALPRGAQVGRFLVLDLIGRGATGMVYSAYDPRLDRRVALKLLHPAVTSNEQARTRLLREAQAIGRLSHPNVVGIFDAMTFQNHIYLALELCEGGTLTDWLAGKKRSPQDVLDLLTRAGEGLAAVHAAGFVHRDFKPRNVLLAKDGSPRVADFGLVGRAGPDTGQDNSDLPSSDAAARELDETLTGTGQRLGTPGYMAPEQIDDGVADERSDQFAFCVSLFEAIYGTRPFQGDLRAMRAQIAKGAQFPRGPRSAAEGVLKRGLSERPSDRYGSMRALLDDPRRARRRRRRWVGIAAALALGVVGSAGAAVEPRRPSPCAGVDALHGAWDGARRDAIARAFRATGAPFAESALTEVERVLSAYGARWQALSVDSCEATKVRHQQSDELRELRAVCLDDRRLQLSAHSDALTHADAKAVQLAPMSVRSLPRSGSLLGRHRAAHRRAAAERSGAAPAHRCSARAAGAGQRAGAERTRRRGAPAAGDARRRSARHRLRHADRRRRADAGRSSASRPKTSPPPSPRSSRPSCTARPRVTPPPRCPRGRIWLICKTSSWGAPRRPMAIGHAEALLKGMGQPPELDGVVAQTHGMVAADPQEKERHYRHSLEVYQKLYGPDDVRLAGVYGNLSNLHQDLGRLDEAEVEIRRALELFERSYGPLHPRTCVARLNLGGLLWRRDKLEDARQECARALEVCQVARGKEDQATALAAMNYANVLEELGRLDEAAPFMQGAYDTLVRLRGADSPALLSAMINFSELQSGRHRNDEAIALAQKAVAVAEKSDAAKSTLANAYDQLAASLLGAGQLREALAAADRSVAICAAALGQGAAFTLHHRILQNRVRLALGNRSGAAELEQILTALATAKDADPLDRPNAQLLLSKALADRDPTRAHALDQEARTALAKMGAAGQRRLAERD